MIFSFGSVRVVSLLNHTQVPVHRHFPHYPCLSSPPPSPFFSLLLSPLFHIVICRSILFIGFSAFVCGFPAWCVPYSLSVLSPWLPWRLVWACLFHWGTKSSPSASGATKLPHMASVLHWINCKLLVPLPFGWLKACGEALATCCDCVFVSK